MSLFRLKPRARQCKKKKRKKKEEVDEVDEEEKMVEKSEVEEKEEVAEEEEEKKAEHQGNSPGGNAGKNHDGNVAQVLHGQRFSVPISFQHLKIVQQLHEKQSSLLKYR